MEKAEMNGLKLPYDIIELIGSHIKNNIRDLESTIIRLLAHSSLSNQEIDYELAKKLSKRESDKCQHQRSLLRKLSEGSLR